MHTLNQEHDILSIHTYTYTHAQRETRISSIKDTKTIKHTRARSRIIVPTSQVVIIDNKYHQRFGLFLRLTLFLIILHTQQSLQSHMQTHMYPTNVYTNTTCEFLRYTFLFWGLLHTLNYFYYSPEICHPSTLSIFSTSNEIMEHLIVAGSLEYSLSLASGSKAISFLVREVANIGVPGYAGITGIGKFIDLIEHTALGCWIYHSPLFSPHLHFPIFSEPKAPNRPIISKRQQLCIFSSFINRIIFTTPERSNTDIPKQDRPFWVTSGITVFCTLLQSQ